jgi:hypothetical protein
VLLCFPGLVGFALAALIVERLGLALLRAEDKVRAPARPRPARWAAPTLCRRLRAAPPADAAQGRGGRRGWRGAHCPTAPRARGLHPLPALTHKRAPRLCLQLKAGLHKKEGKAQARAAAALSARVRLAERLLFVLNAANTTAALFVPCWVVHAAQVSPGLIPSRRWRRFEQAGGREARARGGAQRPRAARLLAERATLSPPAAPRAC